MLRPFPRIKQCAPALGAAVLLLSGCVSQSASDELQAQHQQLEAQHRQLQGRLATLEAQASFVEAADLLFPPGGYQVSEAGKKLIGRVATKLAADQQQKIVVVGYTDNTPIGPDLERQGITSNEILSQKRAEAVMQVAISQGVKPDMIAADGRGDADPVASNNTPAGRAKNRRVEFRAAPPS